MLCGSRIRIRRNSAWKSARRKDPAYPVMLEHARARRQSEAAAWMPFARAAAQPPAVTRRVDAPPAASDVPSSPATPRLHLLDFTCSARRSVPRACPRGRPAARRARSPTRRPTRCLELASPTACARQSRSSCARLLARPLRTHLACSTATPSARANGRRRGQDHRQLHPAPPRSTSQPELARGYKASLAPTYATFWPSLPCRR